MMMMMIFFLQRYLQVEDHLEEIKRENEEKLQSLESTRENLRN